MHTKWREGWVMALLLAIGGVGQAGAAAKLLVTQAWIRAAPPGAMMLAGYAILRNAGDAPVTVTAADSTDFGSVSLHESVEKNGVEHMRALDNITIAPGARVVFAPGGKHFMLMQPARELKMGSAVKIHISTSSGDGTTAVFVVADAAPAAH